MKNYIILFALIALIPFVSSAQTDNTINKGSGIFYFSGKPVFDPSGFADFGEVALDVNTKQIYVYSGAGTVWNKLMTVDTISAVSDTTSLDKQLGRLAFVTGTGDYYKVNENNAFERLVPMYLKPNGDAFVSGDTIPDIAYVDQAEADAKSYADGLAFSADTYSSVDTVYTADGTLTVANRIEALSFADGSDNTINLLIPADSLGGSVVYVQHRDTTADLSYKTVVKTATGSHIYNSFTGEVVDSINLDFNGQTVRFTLQEVEGVLRWVAVNLSPFVYGDKELTAVGQVRQSAAGDLSAYDSSVSGERKLQYQYTVDSVQEILNMNLRLGDRVQVRSTGDEYLVETDSINIVDSISVVPNGSHFARLQSKNKKYKLSSFGISVNNDTTENHTRLQNAINYSLGNTLVSDIDSFAITSLEGSLLISADIKIDFQGNKMKVFPELVSDCQNDIFNVTPSGSGVQSVEIKNLTATLCTDYGYSLDGSFDISSLQGHVLNTGGGIDDTINVKLENVYFKGMYPRGLQQNSGNSGRLEWENGEIECAATNGFGVFGLNKTGIIKNVDFYGCSNLASEWTGSQSYGVQVYFHPYVTTLIDNCRFHGWRDGREAPRAIQYSSGSAFYETVWKYEDTPVDFQVLKNSVFDSLISEKAFVNSWYYQFGVVENCYFNNTGNAIVLVSQLNIKDCKFTENVSIAMFTSYPSLNRNRLNSYYITNSVFKSATILDLNDDDGSSPTGGQFVFNGCDFDFMNSPDNNRFDFAGFNPSKDSSYYSVKLLNSNISHTGNNSFLTSTSAVRLTLDNCDINYYETGRYFSLSNNRDKTIKGSLRIKNSNINLVSDGVSSPTIFFVVSSFDSVGYSPIIIENNNKFNVGANQRIGFTYLENQQYIRIPLSNDIYPDTLQTSALSLEWNYDTYIVNNSTLSTAYLGGAVGSGITDPHRLLKGELKIKFVQNTTVDELGNFDLINTELRAQAGEEIVFFFDSASKKWVQKELSIKDRYNLDPEGAEQLYLRRYGDNQNSNEFVTSKARGTKGTPSAVQLGDILGGIEFHAYDGAGYDVAARIIPIVNDISEDANTDARIIFETGKDALNNGYLPLTLVKNAIKGPTIDTIKGNIDTLQTPSYANLYITSTDPDTLTYTADDKEKLTGWTVGETSTHWAYAAGDLTYTGDSILTTLQYRVDVSDIDITQEFEIAVYVGGVAQELLTDSYTFTASDTTHTFTGKAIIPLDNADTVYIEGRFPGGNQTGQVIINRASVLLERKKLR